MMDTAVTMDDILAARKRIAAHVVRTPLLPLPDLERECGVPLFGKCENLQPTGSFKVRGASNAVFSLPDDIAARGVVTHSSGNHAAALARAASMRGIPAYIVMPDNSADNKLQAVRSYGVQPVLCEPTAEARAEAARAAQERTGATFVHPYDNPHVIAGQGTVGLEILDQDAWGIDDLIVPVGGGGLLAGCLIAIKSQRPKLRVIAAEPRLADDAYRSWKLGSRQPVLRYDTIADGLRTPVGELTFPIIRSLIDDIVPVDEREIIAATDQLLRRGRVVAEPSGAVALAALLADPTRFHGRNVAVLLSGGNLHWNHWPPAC